MSGNEARLQEALSKIAEIASAAARGMESHDESSHGGEAAAGNGDAMDVVHRDLAGLVPHPDRRREIRQQMMNRFEAIDDLAVQHLASKHGSSDTR